jgi:hypothetical protein
MLWASMPGGFAESSRLSVGSSWGGAFSPSTSRLSFTENSIPPRFRIVGQIIALLRVIFAILRAVGIFVADSFESRCRLEAENLLLRHQLTIALRRASPRPRLFGGDRALLVWIPRLLAEPSWCDGGG